MKDIRIEKITMNTMPCCTYQEDEKHIFIGYFLGGVCNQYRDSIEEYQDFQSFYSEINDQVQQLKVNYDQEIEQIKREMRTLYEIYPKLDEIQNKNIYYTIPNDCGSCT